MKLANLCFVLTLLVAGAFSESLREAPEAQDVGEKIQVEVADPTADTQLDNALDQLEGFIDDLFAVEPQGAGEGRTFGVKRLQFMMMPMIYKMGVMMTMLTVLTVISLKGLAVGVILLVLKLSAIFGKFYASLHYHGHGWAPPPPPAPQPVHLYLHNSGLSPHHDHSPYNSWEPPSGPTADEHYYYKG